MGFNHVKVPQAQSSLAASCPAQVTAGFEKANHLQTLMELFNQIRCQDAGNAQRFCVPSSLCLLRMILSKHIKTSTTYRDVFDV